MTHLLRYKCLSTKLKKVLSKKIKMFGRAHPILLKQTRASATPSRDSLLRSRIMKKPHKIKIARLSQ